MIKIIKTTVLIFLVILCVYQASLLWSKEVDSSTDFVFAGDPTSYQEISLEDEVYLLTPNKLGVYLERDPKVFTIIKRTNVYYDNIYAESSEALIEALKHGELFSRGVAIDELFNSRSIFYTLYKDVSKDVFIDVFGVHKDMMVGMDVITSFGIILSTNVDSFAFAYLINDKEEVNVYQIKNEKTGRIVSNLNYYIDQVQMNDKLPIYNSSVFENLEMIDSHVLLPTTDNQLSYTKEIYFYTPYINIDGIIYNAVEDYVNGFEPGAKWEVRRPHDVSFGTEKKLITYNDQGVFHYQVVGDYSKAALSLSESYQLATSFIKKDQQISRQEYYLKDYIKTEKGYEFHYGYSFVDYPMILDADYAASLGVAEPMVVEVAGDQVINYKRLMINMEDIGPDDKIFNSDYYEAIVFFISENTLEKPIEDVFLGYYWDDVDRAKMRWIFEYNHMYYSIGL